LPILLALNNYTTIILNITFVSYLDSQFSQALLTLRIYTCTSQMCIGPITSSYKHHVRCTSYTLIYSTGTSSTPAKTYYQIQNGYSTSVYQRMAIFWKKFVHCTPKYHSTSVYRCMAIFWKKWVQRTILRECTDEWLFYVSVPTYGYVLEKNLSTVLRSTTLRRCTGVRLLFRKSYYTKKEENG
jgi:hypothetical protein